MAQQLINTGLADKGNGDPIRTAFTKVNENFAELYNSVSAVVVASATAPTAPAVGDLWWNSVDGRMYVYYSSAWVDASPVDGAGISSTNQLVNGDSSFSISSDGTLTLTHPDEPALHPLATVLTVQKAAGNYHTISGAYGLSLQATPVPSGSGLNTNTNFVDIFHDGISVNVDNNTWAFGTDGSLAFPQGTTIATADGTDAFIIDGAVDKDIQIYTYSGPTPTAHGWTFGSDGTLTFPGPNGTGATFASNDPTGTDVLHSVNNLNLESEKALNLITGQDIEGLHDIYLGAEQTWVDIRDQDAMMIAPDTRPWDGMPSYEAYPVLMNYVSGPPGGGVLPPNPNMPPVAKTASDAWQAYQAALNASIVNIEVGDYLWQFKPDGELTVPGAIRKNSSLYLNSGGVDKTSSVVLQGEYGRVFIRTIDGLVQNEWYFKEDGTLTFPDSTVQTTAWTGITGFGEGFSLTAADKIVTNKLYSTNLTQPTQHYRLELDTNGVVRLPDGSIINGSTIRGVAGTGELNYTGITIGPNSNDAEKTWMWVNHANAYVSTNNAANTWTFGNDGGLTFPNGALKIADNTISNYVASEAGASGSQLEVSQSKTVITNGVTNSLGGGPSLTGQSLFEVSTNGILSSFQVINSLGEGESALTSEYLTELDNLSFKIGQRVTNDLGDGSEPLVAFSGWTFSTDAPGYTKTLTLPNGAVISDTASSPGLLSKKYSGTFVLDPTWFAANAGNLIETSTITGTIQNVDNPFDPYCFEYTGYFVPPTSAIYTFKAHADETFIFWIGDKALSGYTFANKDMYGDFNGDFNEQQTQSFEISLTAGQFYPIRIQWGNSGGFGQLDVFTWARFGQADSADFSGLIYTANTGAAIVSVSDNKSIVLRTDNDITNNWNFAPDGSLTFPDNTVQSTAYVAPTTGNSTIISDPEGTTVSRNGMTIRVTSAGMIQMSFNSAINVKGRSSINNADSVVIASPNGVTTIGTWYNIGAVLAEGDHLTATIVDESYHHIYRLTAIIIQKTTTPGQEIVVSYAIIEQLQ